MSVKTVAVFCVQAFFIQIVLSQYCISRAAIDSSRCSSPYGIAGFPQASPAMTYETLAAPGMAYNGWTGCGLPNDEFYSPAMEFTTTNGGGLPVTSISSISPSGIIVKSDNAYEGPVFVTGELPFISAVAVEGNLPTAGAGGIEYGCGNGIVAMLSQGPVPTTTGSTRPGAYSPGFNVAYGAGSGFDSGLALGLGNSFNLAAGSGHPAGLANANRLGYGGCGCGMLY